MNGATMAAARLVLTGGVYNDRALRAMAERHDRHCLQDADRLCQEAGIGSYNGCVYNALVDEGMRRCCGEQVTHFRKLHRAVVDERGL
jgi:hypothetical protein